MHLELRSSKAQNQSTLSALQRFRQLPSFLNGYNDSPLLRIGGKFQGSVSTVFHYFARKLGQQVFIPYRRERFTLKDGGTVALDWALPSRSIKDKDEQHQRPLVFIHHGLCGSSESVYVTHLIASLESRYDAVVLVARGCGGLELTTSDGFTAARTDDMRETLDAIHERFPGRKVYAVGFSLGAGLLLKYLGEEGSSSRLQGAVSISPAFDFHKTPEHFELWSQFRLVHGLVEWAKSHSPVLSSHPQVDWDKLMAARTVREFDQAAIVDRYQYKDVDAYYLDASPRLVSDKITVPCLTLNAWDDPVCWAGGVPPDLHEEMGPGLVSLITQRGGHVAFAEGWWPGDSWMDRIALDWFKACEECEK